MEIDGFKSLYQQHGDDQVDRILVWLADIFSATCRREDTVARIGGAAFAVVAPATSQEKAEALCRRLVQAVARKPFVSGTTEIPVSLNVGAVTLEEAGAHTYDELMQIAEHRIRQARNTGGDHAVTLEAIEPSMVEEGSPDAAATARVSMALPEAAELSGLEIDIPAFSQDTVPLETAAFARLPDQNAAAESLEFVGLDAALQRLANGEGDSIEPWLDSIAQRLLPLLEFYSERRAGVLAAGIADIKMRCLSPG